MSTLTRGAANRILLHDIRSKAYQTETRLGPSVAQYLAWKRMSGAADTTLSAYEFVLALLCAMFPDTELEDFDAGMLLEAVATLPEKSRRTRGKAPLADFFKWATAWKRLQFNPVALLPDFKVSEKRRIYDIFTPDERAKIIRAASIDDPRANRIPVRDKAAVLGFLDTGGRKTDWRLLQWRDVDIAERFVIFRHRKGDQESVVSFGLTLQQALLDAYHSPYPRIPFGEAASRSPLADDYVLYPNGYVGRQLMWVKPGKPMSVGAIHRWWYRILQDAGIVDPEVTSGRRLHLTRHTHGTEMYEATGDIHLTGERLGHQSLESTKIYVHNSRKRDRASVEALELYHQTLKEEPAQ